MIEDVSFLKTVDFVRYKKTVETIVGKDNWNEAPGLYIQRYKDFLNYRGGYTKLLHVLDLCKKTQRKADKTAAAKYLNKLLSSFLTILKSEGFEKEK